MSGFTDRQLHNLIGNILRIGVIVAGVLVYLLGSNKPDLVVGTVVFVVVVRGALKILKLGK